MGGASRGEKPSAPSLKWRSQESIVRYTYKWMDIINGDIQEILATMYVVCYPLTFVDLKEMLLDKETKKGLAKLAPTLET